jgi:predicted ATPase
LLWIKGKPGSGKSTLMKEAYRRAGQQLPAVSPIIAAFFFNARGSRLEKSPLGLFRSVLHQILQQDRQLLTEMLQIFQEKELTRGESGGQWEWHLAELQYFFKLAFTKPNSHRTTIFVDALFQISYRFCLRCRIGSQYLSFKPALSGYNCTALPGNHSRMWQ